MSMEFEQPNANHLLSTCDWDFSVDVSSSTTLKGMAMRRRHVEPSPGGITKDGHIELPQLGESEWEVAVVWPSESEMKAAEDWIASGSVLVCRFDRAGQTVREPCLIDGVSVASQRFSDGLGLVLSLVRVGAPLTEDAT